MASPFDKLKSIKEPTNQESHSNKDNNKDDNNFNLSNIKTNNLNQNKYHNDNNFTSSNIKTNNLNQDKYHSNKDILQNNSKNTSLSIEKPNTGEQNIKIEDTTIRRVNNYQKLPTGIPGLDQMTYGGLKNNSVNLLTGGPGTGKTIFGLQYIINGIHLYHEPGIFITFDEPRESIIEDVKSIGWDLRRLEREGLFHLVEYSPEQLMKILKEGGGLLDNLMSKSKAKRIVIDSISTFLLISSSNFGKREQLSEFFKLLKKWGVTTLLTNEDTPIKGNHIYESLTLGFEVDSIIQLYYDNSEIGNEAKRFIEIYKMRGSNHVRKALPYTIENNGIRIG
ncbi:MAG: RAD55 family ATPase [Candidatus Woesearchaeota archaeon]